MILIQPRTDSRAALRAAAAKGGPAVLGAEREFGRLTPADMGRGDTELLRYVGTAAMRTPRHIAGAANEGFKSVVTGFTVILIKRHGWKDSSKFSIIAPCKPSITRAAAN